MRQIYPHAADLADDDLAALYAYPASAPAPYWLRANMVSSLDGAATLGGRSGGLSGEADRHVFALLRSLADVILVGAGTVRAESYGPARPRTEGAEWAWLREGLPPSPPIAILSRSLNLGPTEPLLAQAPGYARTIVITTQAAPPERRAALGRVTDVIVAGARQVDLRVAAGALAARGHRHILTEGGPHLLGQIIEAGLLDELCLTISPLLAGPGAGRIVQSQSPQAGTGLPTLNLRHVLADQDYLLCRYARPV